MSVVVDSSVLLAVTYREPGFDTAFAALSDASISAVNVSEVVAKYVEQGSTPEDATQSVTDFGLRVEPFDREQAFAAGLLRLQTRRLGLSLGDRACLALALREGWPALTADRAWADLDVGVKITLIR